MEPALKDCSVPKPRPSRPLYGLNTKPGKKELPSGIATDRKSLFKAPQNGLRLKQNNRTPNRGFPGQMQSGANKKESLRKSRALTSASNVNRYSKMNNVFLRPSVDVRTARKHIMERAVRLAQQSLQDDADKSTTVNDFTNLRTPTVPCTPKHLAFSKAYLKPSGSKMKLTSVKAPLTPTSPFTEAGIIHRKFQNSSNESNGCLEKKLGNAVHLGTHDVATQCHGTEDTEALLNSFRDCVEDIKENKMPKDTIPVVGEKINGHISDKGNALSHEKEMIQDIGNRGAQNCVLNNVLKHCQLYSSKMSSINDAIRGLDDSFQRVMVGEIGGQVYFKFCEYQRKKLDLFREIKVIEEELEEEVRNEVDVQSKFQEYLRKRNNIMQERSDLQEHFKTIVKQIIDDYEENINKPQSGKDLASIVQALDSSTKAVEKKAEDFEKIEPVVVRRSKRLMGTPKSVKNAKSPRLQSKQQNIEGKDDLVIKKSRKSSESKRIQRNIYKDLQKSFNLCSPECSF